MLGQTLSENKIPRNSQNSEPPDNHLACWHLARCLRILKASRRRDAYAIIKELIPYLGEVLALERRDAASIVSEGAIIAHPVLGVPEEASAHLGQAVLLLLKSDEPDALALAAALRPFVGKVEQAA